MSKRVTLFWDPRANLEERRAAKATQRYTHFRNPQAAAEELIYPKGSPPACTPERGWRREGFRDNPLVTPGNDKCVTNVLC